MLARGGNDYAWHLGACKALRVLSAHPEALSNCRKALETDPTAYPVYRELGLTYAAAGNPRKAAEMLEQGVEISSASCQAHYHLARALEKRGDSARAAASYRRGLALAELDKSPEAGYYKALNTAGLKRAELSKKRMKKAAPKAPKASKAPKPEAPDQRSRSAECVAKFREELLKDNPAAALAQSDSCLKLAPSDPELARERAPVMVRLWKYDEGVMEYERAAALYGPQNPSASLCRIKAGETWRKLGKPEKAAAQFRLALTDAPQDMNALEGLAAALEAGSEPAGAIEIYDAILKLEPGNKNARARREELKTSALSAAQMLDEMKLRKAVDKKIASLSPEEVKLFKAIKAAELAGAANYLKGKTRSVSGLTMHHQTPEGTRVLLTGAGYKAYIYHASREAVKFFEGEGVGMRELFKLRTTAGEPVFDPAGRLTPEGADLWRNSAPGNKTWLLTYEAVAESPQAVQANKDVIEAEKNGYREIYEPEYLWLLRATDCPEDVMVKNPVYLRIINDGAKVRYMLCYISKSSCMNPLNESLPSYIEAYRAGNDHISDAKTSTAFFGSGGVKKHRYCENGKVMGIDMPEPPLPQAP
jgi:tetratricopeptide (TPR) repeat protein